MTLSERIAGVRLCVACGAHEAVRDGSECSDCLNAFLRRTRPESIRQPEWLRRSKERPEGLRRDLTNLGAAL